MMRPCVKWAMVLCALWSLQGCAVAEGIKKVAGNSTQTLQEQRSEAISKAFFCSYQDCYEAIMSLGRRKDSVKPWVHNDEPDMGIYDIFMSDLYANPPYIILMGVTGNVDTTEVGVFFTRLSQETIQVDITSLSSSAKRRVADTVFKLLGERFTSVE